jgi:hypothetical protein
MLHTICGGSDRLGCRIVLFTQACAAGRGRIPKISDRSIVLEEHTEKARIKQIEADAREERAFDEVDRLSGNMLVTAPNIPKTIVEGIAPPKQKRCLGLATRESGKDDSSKTPTAYTGTGAVSAALAAPQ